jgi:hypothetical protein
MPVEISSTTIEFHRFGGESDSLQKGRAYIRTCGYQRAADQVVVGIEPKELKVNMNRLRYRPERTPETENAAKQRLGDEAENFLPPSQFISDKVAPLHQVDIVTHASELRAYPFEAIYANPSNDYLDAPDRGVVLTRRIRSEFSFTVPPWPEVPAVLFVHAEVAHDLSQDLIDEHRIALTEALAPWGKPEVLEEKKLLTVCKIGSVAELAVARKLANFSYVHILAHGARVFDPDLDESDSEWGLRLGQDEQSVASAEAIAAALKPVDERPLVVTLAACDSGTSDNPWLGNTSLAETLHRNGIPVVVASQFPLTKPGSVTLTKEFYRPLLSREDVRMALHGARVALREEAKKIDERRHDWLSIVGYVRLPAEGYSLYLKAFGLRVQLHLLEAARKDAEPFFTQSPPLEMFETVAKWLDERINDLRTRRSALSGDTDSALEAECTGLLASASKSLAEVRFVQALRFPDEKSRCEDLSKKALENSLQWYSQSYRRDMSKHWQGIQKLAVEAALTGRISNPTELMFVHFVARNACEDNPKEYWACGTLAEAILLEVLTTEALDLAGSRTALTQLCERSATDGKDNGFAVQSTRRQLGRYMTWWTKNNGYFPGRESDIAAYAEALVQHIDKCSHSG